MVKRRTLVYRVCTVFDWPGAASEVDVAAVQSEINEQQQELQSQRQQAVGSVFTARQHSLLCRALY